MGLNPLLHVIQSCAGVRSKGDISAFVDPRNQAAITTSSAPTIIPTMTAMARLDFGSCAGGRSKGDISAFVDSIAPEVSAGRVFPLSAAPRPVEPDRHHDVVGAHHHPDY